ncbi:MAG TPA: hypothetical protein VG894_08785 [Bauldia sp.]|nr:hypothetical protein [Bauldia sp.]
MGNKVEHHPVTLRVTASPTPVDAGAPVSFAVEATCPDGCDLSYAVAAIRGDDGATRASARLTRQADGGFRSEPVTFPAPATAGDHAFEVALVEPPGVERMHDAVTKVTLSVTAHAAYVHTWDAPSAVAAGARFNVTVGIKCSCGCDLSGRSFRILDEAGGEVAAGTLGREPWPGTGALYFAVAEAVAPNDVGDRAWSVESSGGGLPLPHAAGVAHFPVKVVAAPDYEVRIEVADRASDQPVSGVQVVMHPYRASTDESGVARIWVAKGSYRLHVSGRRYLPCQNSVDADRNLVVKVRLAAELPQSPFFPMPVKQEPSVSEVLG